MKEYIGKNRPKTNQLKACIFNGISNVCLLDPEATESSSGGDSADEDEKYTPGAVLYAPIKERAKYRYLKKVGRRDGRGQEGYVSFTTVPLNPFISNNDENIIVFYAKV